MTRSIQRTFLQGVAVAMASVAAAAILFCLTVTGPWWWLGGLIAIAILLTVFLLSRRAVSLLTDTLERLRQWATDPRAFPTEPLEEVRTFNPVDHPAPLPEELRALVEDLNLAALHRAEALRRLLEERRLAAMEHRGEALRRLVNGIARETQRPLAGIGGFAERALSKTHEAEHLKTQLTLIAQYARSGHEALDRVLRYAEPPPGAPEVLDLNALVLRKAEEHRKAAAERGLSIRTELCAAAPLVQVDRLQLLNTIDALIENAMEASEPDAAPIELCTNQDQPDAALVIVRDHGRGIPNEQQHLVCTPFFTTKTTRLAGLSLAFADAFVRRSGGRMDFASRPGEGTVFFITLPAQAHARSPTTPELGAPRDDSRM